MFYNYKPIKLPDTPATELPDGYVWAKDSDFKWFGDQENGAWHYIGKANKVAIPRIIQGKNVTSYKHMFDGTSVSGVYSDNPDVKNMEGMLANSQATTLDLTYLDTSNVTNMAGMFYNTKVTSLDLSKLNTSKVTNMTGMFSNCQTTTLDLSSFDTRSVVNMSNMFSGAQAREGYAKTQNDADRFNASTGKPSELHFMVKLAKLPDGYVWAKDSDFKWETGSFWSDGVWHYIGNADKVAIPHTIYGKEVASYRGMFYNTPVIGVYSDNTNITDMSSMFAASTATNLDLTYLDTSSATDMNYMFSSCQATSLGLSKFNTRNVTDMSGMFHESQATSLNLSNFNTSNVKNMSNMFDRSNATSLDLSSFNTSKVANMGGMFSGSKAISLNLSSFDTSNVTSMHQMFFDSKATTLDLSSFDTTKVTNMGNMFYNSKATRGYAKAQKDADKLNATTTNRPSTLTFIVNP